MQQHIELPAVAGLTAILFGLWPGSWDAIVDAFARLTSVLSLFPPARPALRTRQRVARVWFLLLGLAFLLLALVAGLSN